MTNLANPPGFMPVLPHTATAPDGTHCLTGTRCPACGAVMEGPRMACAACGSRTVEPVNLGMNGRIAAHTVVHRSFPGVQTPFVSVVVDLDGGGCVKGTLVQADPLADPPERVRMIFRDTGQRDPQGRAFLCHAFVPEGEPA